MTRFRATKRVRFLWDEFYRIVRCYRFSLKLAWEADPKYMTLNTILILVSSAVLPAQIWLSKIIIDRITAIIQVVAEGGTLDWSWLLFPMLLLLGVKLIGSVCQSFSEKVGELSGLQVSTHAQYLILKKASELDIAFYENPSFFDQMQVSLNEIWRVEHLTFLTLAIGEGLLALGTLLGFLVRLHPAVVPMLLLATLPYLVARSYYANKQNALRSASVPADRMVSYLAHHLLGSRDAIKEVHLFGLSDIFLGRFRHFWHEFREANKKLGFSAAWIESLCSLLSMASVIVIWVLAIVRAGLSQITVGDFVLVYQAVEQAQVKLGRLFSTGGLFYGHTLYLSNLFDFLALRPDAVEGTLSRSIASDDLLSVPNPFCEGIEFKNVSFCYPGSEQYVLRNLSFVVRPGETVALVGENGAGKTTIVKLIARLYDPAEGDILLDGRSLQEYDLGEYQRRIGVIFQDFVRYHLTVQENIGFGQVEFLDDREQVARAAGLGGALPMIERLPKRFDTVLGKTFEEGVDLSGGQWQKLALGRAFMRQNTQILILDEPTAGLDPRAEHKVYEQFSNLTEGKTTILVTHRLWTVKMAHRILFLNEGRLVEEGSHKELMALDGEYAGLFKVQAEKYET